jgi:cytochrome P450/NAD(P)-dependent dehydrogenase (short-subunit alcohol dehydrogenase family)
MSKAINLLDASLFTGRREHEVFRRLRDSDPVYFHPEPNGPGFYAVTRHFDASEVLRNPTAYCNGKGTQIQDKRAEGHGAPSIHNLDAPRHAKLRSAAVPGIRREVLNRLEPQVRRIVRDLIDACPRGEPFDFVEKVAIALPMMVIGEMLGVPLEDRPLTVDWANTMTSTSAGEAAQAKARGELFRYFRRLVAAKRTAPAEDLATILAQATVDGEPLSQEELDAYFMVLTAAGNETTRFLISGGLEQLCLQPDDLAALAAAPEIISDSVEEMARWVSPVMMMRRTATEETALAGAVFKPGDKVVVVGQSRRAQIRRAGQIHPGARRQSAYRLRTGAAFLPRRASRAARGAHLLRGAVPAGVRHPPGAAGRKDRLLLVLRLRQPSRAVELTMSAPRFVVTGAASGIGAATLAALKAAGRRCLAIDRNPMPGEDFLACDLADESSIAACVEAIDGPVDGVAHVAGIAGTAEAAQVLKVTISARADSSRRCRRRSRRAAPSSSCPASRRVAAPRLRAMLAFSDWHEALAALDVADLDGGEAYEIAKRLLLAWLPLTVASGAARRIRFNAVTPGPVETPLLPRFRQSMGEDRIEAARRSLVGRHALPQEVAAPILFLLGPASSWMNGIEIVADGGLSALREATAA